MAALLEHAALFRFTRAAALAELRRVHEVVQTWPGVAAANGVTGADATLFGDAVALQAPEFVAALG